MQRAKEIPGRALAMMLALALSVLALAAAIWIPATNESVMLRLMRQFAPSEKTGLPAPEYPAMADMITAYLRGEIDDFQLVYAQDGAEYLCFHDYEQQHMADVQGLFRVCGAAAWLSGSAALIFGLGGRRRIVWRTFRRTVLAVLAAVTVLIALAAADFSSLFILFHKVAFTNDLWLLNPQTDLLIRLMPIDFFISYAAIIGVLWLLGMAMLLIGSTAIINKSKSKQIDEGE